jgi:murein hydrolase activator
MFCIVKTIFKRLIVLFALVAFSNVTIAGTDEEIITDETINKYREQVRELDRKIGISKEEIDILSREETAVLNVLNNIDINLAAYKKQIAECRSELSGLETELEKMQMFSKELEKRVESVNDYAKKRLVAIYKMHRLGSLSLIASADSFSEFLFRKKALERIFVHDEETLMTLMQDQVQLNEVLKEIKIKKERKLDLEKELKNQIAKIESGKKKRGEILGEIQRKKSLEKELIEAYRQAAIILDKKIASLNFNPGKMGTKFTSGKPFESFKGLLNIPVNGTITTKFGSYRDKRLNVNRFNNGISVRADRGEPIHAVKDGLILYAGWFKGYGQMIIIDHGQHYYTVYAHAEELFKDKGDPVESGEVIATVGDSGSIFGPELYFEVRHYGKPVDPLEWIRKG